MPCWESGTRRDFVQLEYHMLHFHASHARVSSPRIPALRRRPLPILLLVLLPAISGCEKENPTAGTLPGPASTERTGAPSSAVAAFDLAGRPVDPFQPPDARAFVFIFVSTDCPISNRYAPEIRRVAQEFARSDVRFRLVYPDADTTSEAIRQHMKEFQLPLEALRDPQHGLVRLGQIHVTPEAAIFLPGRRLVYHGRIDNRYAELGKERPEATQHDLEDLLKAILEGRPVPYATARAVGCYISDPK